MSHGFLMFLPEFALLLKSIVTYSILCLLILFLLFMPITILRYNLMTTQKKISTSISKLSSFLCLLAWNVSFKPGYMHVLILVCSHSLFLLLLTLFHTPAHLPSTTVSPHPRSLEWARVTNCLHWTLLQGCLTYLCGLQVPESVHLSPRSHLFLQKHYPWFSSMEFSNFMGNRSLTPNLPSYNKNTALNSLAVAKSVSCERFTLALWSLSRIGVLIKGARHRERVCMHPHPLTRAC